MNTALRLIPLYRKRVPVLSFTFTTSSFFPLGPFLKIVVLVSTESDRFAPFFCFVNFFPEIWRFWTCSFSIWRCLLRLRSARAETVSFILIDDATDVDGERRAGVSNENVTVRGFVFCNFWSICSSLSLALTGRIVDFLKCCFINKSQVPIVWIYINRFENRNRQKQR